MKIKDISLKNAKLLNEGISNTSYLIINKYVYRSKKEKGDPFNKSKNEAIAIKKVAHLPYSEKVLEYNKLTGEKLSLFIQDTTRLSSTFNKEELDLVIKAIKRIHKEIKINFSFNAFKRLKAYKEGIVSEIDPKKEKEIIAQAKALYKKYPKCFSHNDLVKGNILFKDKEIYLLDYEYSGNNIELFDIASFLSENNYLEKEMISYFAKHFDYSISEINKMIDFENVLWYYWAKQNYKKSKRKIFLEIAKEKLNNI